MGIPVGDWRVLCETTARDPLAGMVSSLLKPALDIAQTDRFDCSGSLQSNPIIEPNDQAATAWGLIARFSANWRLIKSYNLKSASFLLWNQE